MAANASSLLPSVCEAGLRNDGPSAMTVVLSIAFLCVLLADSAVNSFSLYQLVKRKNE